MLCRKADDTLGRFLATVKLRAGMDLADVISQVESNGNQFLQRFERLHLGASGPALLGRIMSANRCSQPTADVYASMSHGLFQIMGFRLYGDAARDRRNLEYGGSVAQYLASVPAQKNSFEKYCRQNGIHFTVGELIQDAVKRARFAEIYNGPRDVALYSSRILAAIHAGTTQLAT